MPALFAAALGCGGGTQAPSESGSAGTSSGSGASGGTTASAGSGSGTGGSGNQSGAASSGTGGGSAGTDSGGTSSVGGTDNGGGSAGDGPGGGGSSSGGGQAGPVTCRSAGDGVSTVSFVNQCDGVLSFRGSDIEGGDLAPGEHACRDVGSDVESIPAIRFWGFIGEDPGGEKHTLAELTLNTDFNDFDWFNISHVDAHNLPMQIVAVDMPECRVLTCADSLLEDCPEVGKLYDGDSNLISCYSPDRDNPDSEVAQYFEAGCADAYSWSGDDFDSVVACAGEDYDVIFCP
jgi:hypothetical protein